MGDTLTEAGRSEVEAIARRREVPTEAVATLLAALRRGGGRQAQFSHPALGGMGQWSRGGGTMIGDMFNHSLKAKVEQLCNELAKQIDDGRLFAAEGAAPDGIGGPAISVVRPPWAARTTRATPAFRKAAGLRYETLGASSSTIPAITASPALRSSRAGATI